MHRCGSRLRHMLGITAFLRMIALNSLSTLRATKIGGPGRIVEIDETLVAHRKFGVGRLVGKQWLFGVVVR